MLTLISNVNVKIIGINSATSYTEIAAINGTKTVFYKGWKSDFNEAEELLKWIKSIPGIDQSPVSGDTGDWYRGLIFVVKGPGSFTGLRIGVTIANTLAYGQNSTIIPLGTFEYLEEKLPPKNKKNTAIILRAGGGNVVVKIHGAAKKHHMKSDELEQFLNKKEAIKFVVGDIKEEDQIKYTIPARIKWLKQEELQPLDKIMKKISIQKRKHHKLIKPVYFAPPTITKSKKHLKGSFNHLKG